MISVIKQETSYIHGRFTDKTSRAIHPNINPATNEIISEVAYACDADLQQAISSARQAFHLWRDYTIEQRSQILLRAADLLRQSRDELARLEVLDTGKPITEAWTVDILSAAESLTYFAKAALALDSQVIPHASALIYTLREPLGVCVGIGAWNYPLQIACWKAAPALMMGNTMVYKPSELTPATTCRLAEIFSEAGLPPGVFNVVLGDGEVAENLLTQSGIAKVSFTGSVLTGKKISRQISDSLLPLTLELGGKSPLLVFSDAEMDQAVTGCLLANFYTQGEICSNGTRVYVARSCYDEFLAKCLARTRQIKIGDPLDPETQLGALISEPHLAKVQNYVNQGRAQGASLLCGGNRITTRPLNRGNFFEPTIFASTRDDITLVSDEIFGPVMTVLAFDEEEEVIMRANNTVYGLASGVFTRDIKRGHRIAKQLQAGICWINNYNQTPSGMPFGGYKQSGFGRENAFTTLLQYSQLKSVYVELDKIENHYVGGD